MVNDSAFHDTVSSCGYQIEITGADNSSQNGKVERPHRTLSQMMRAALSNAYLNPKYWSDALSHSVFIKNRLPHSIFDFKSTPYQQLTGVKPNLTNLKVFGTRITVRKPGLRSAKISNHFYSGIFLRYAKTMRNFVYIDTTTKRIKTSTHAEFDEAHYSQESRPRGARALMHLGYSSKPSTKFSPKEIKPSIQAVTNIQTVNPIHHLLVATDNEDAIIPRQATQDAAGYDLYSFVNMTISPDSLGKVNTRIKVRLYQGTYGRIASRSGLVLRHKINTQGGVIDPDYTGCIQVLLHNFGKMPFEVHKGDRIV